MNTTLQTIASAAHVDMLIEQAEVGMRFPAYAAALAAYGASDQAGAKRMVTLTSTQSMKKRRERQSGVDMDIDSIERALAKLGHHVLADKPRYGDTTLLGVQIAFEEVIDTTSYRYRSTGKYSLYVGQRWSDGDRKRFPQKSDGTYSYAKIAEEIASRYERRVAKLERERVKNLRKASSAELVAQLRDEMGVTGHNDIFKASLGVKQGKEYVEYAPEEGKVWMCPGNLQVTPEQARAVYAVLREQGLVK